MTVISFERVAIAAMLIASVIIPSSSAAVAGALGLMALDAFKYFVANKKQSEATKEEIIKLREKIESIDKLTQDRMSLVDNKLAGLGLSRRNA